MKPIVGIPVYKDRECFEEMLKSLHQSTGYFERIIIIESDGDKEYWDKIERNNQHIQIIHTKKEGPLKAYNKLFEIAKNENKDLLITQTDVLFSRLYKRDWLHTMSKISENNDIGLVIPINGGGRSGEDYINGLFWVGGWCTYISNKCWQFFKEYDTNFPMGYGVDIEMTYIINKAGLKTFQMNYWVDHHMFNERAHDNSPGAENARKEAGKYFRNKWGIDK